MSGPRVVSLLPSATEIVAALGFADTLMGRSHECDFPEEVLELPVCTEPKVDAGRPSDEIHRSVSALLAESLSVYRVDARALRELAPTHVVTQVQCEVCAVSLEEVEEALSEWSGERPRLVALNPASLEDVFADIARVASALGAPGRGARLVASLRARMDAITAALRGIPFRPTVATIEWLSPLMTAGNWMPELIAMAGGTDVLGVSGAHSRGIEWEELCAADPEVLLVFPCGFPLARVEREIGLLTERPGWAALRAVRDGRVYLAESNQYFNRPGPRLLETLEIVAEVLHPEAFAFGHEGEGWLRLRARAARDLNRIGPVRRLSCALAAFLLIAPAVLRLAGTDPDADARRCAMVCGHAAKVAAGAACCPMSGAVQGVVLSSCPAGDSPAAAPLPSSQPAVLAFLPPLAPPESGVSPTTLPSGALCDALARPPDHVPLPLS